MIEASGIVVELEAGRAGIQPLEAPGCHGCSTGGCGTASLARYFRRRQRTLWVGNGIGAKLGDSVIIGMEESSLMRMTWTVYALPLLGLLLGGIVGEELADGASPELAAPLLGLMGLFTGIAVARFLSTSRAGVKDGEQAQIVRIETPALGNIAVTQHLHP